MDAFLSSRLARIVSLCLWGGSVAIMAAGALHKAHRVNGNDFTMYLDAARAVLAGQNPYLMSGPLHYMYPLFFATLLAPLTALPRDAAVLLWFAASVASLLGAARITIGLARRAGVLRPEVSLTVPLVALWFLLFDPIQSDLLNGQVNFVVLLLCLLTLRACLARRTLGTAWPLAAAIAVKLNPALLLGFLGTRRRWAAVALCVLLGALFVLAPAVALGRTGWSAYEFYVGAFLLPRLHAEMVSHRDVRFSVNGVLGMLAPGWGHTPWQRALGAGVPLLALAAIELRARRRPAPARDLWIFCLYLIVLLLLTPYSEVHHLVYAMPGAALVALRAVPALSGSRVGPSALGVVAVFALLGGGRLSRSGPYLFLALCVLGALVAVDAVRSGAAREPDAARGSLS